MNLSKIYTYYDTHLWCRIIYILILSFYPAFAVLIEKDTEFYNFISKYFGVLIFLYPDKLAEKICIAFWVPFLSVITHILGYFAKKDYYYLNREGFVLLADSLDEIVAKKSERIAKAIKEKNYDIKLIANPEQQIKTIIDELYHTIKNLFDVKNDIAIRLWSVKNNQNISLLYMTPSNDELVTSIDLLKSHNSELKKVLKSKRSVIINDSKKDKTFFIADNCMNCDGCNIFTIPIIDNILNDTYAILQIRIKFVNNKVITFQSKNKRNYISILDRYIKRINFEHRMLELYNLIEKNK